MPSSILQPYTGFVAFLGRALGPDYEIALYDLADSTHPLIAVANSRGRPASAPSEDTLRRALAAADSVDCVDEEEGAGVRTCFHLIRQEGRPVGLMCVRFDDSRYRCAAEEILRLCRPYAAIEPLRPSAAAAAIDTAAFEAIRRELGQLGVSAERLTADERLRIIGTLEQDGVFRLKGAVRDAARALHCSQASVYRYLSQVKKSESQTV